MLIVENGPESPVLVRPIENGEDLIDFQVDLLVRRQPAWALEAAIRLKGSQPQLVLQLAGLASLETIDYPDLYSHSRGCLRLLAIVKAVLSAQDELIEPEQILLTPESIFFDPDTDDVRLAVIPVLPNGDPSQPFECSFRSLLKSVQKAYTINSELVEVLSRQADWNNLTAIESTLTAIVQGPQPGQASAEESGKTTDTGSGNESNPSTDAEINPQAKPGSANQAISATDTVKHSRLVLYGLAAIHLVVTLSLLIPLELKLLVPAASPLSGSSMIENFAGPAFVNHLRDLAIFRNISYYPTLAILATLLLVFDLTIAGLFHYCAHLIAAGWSKSAAIISGMLSGRTQPGHSADSTSLLPVRPPKTPVQLHQRSDIDPSGQTILLAPAHEAYRLGLLSVGLPGSPEESEGLRAYILVDEFLIGRDETYCDLPLPIASIGRRHARITRREGSFFITDLGSKNGTNLDGRRLNKLEEYLLPDRCRLEFADQAFYFSAD